MRGYVKRCSHLARMFSVGQSVHGRDLWVLEVSTKPGLEEAKPRVKYVANMHGDEPAGRCAWGAGVPRQQAHGAGRVTRRPNMGMYVHGALRSCQQQDGACGMTRLTF